MRWVLPLCLALLPAPGAADLCTYFARQRLVDFPDVLVMPVPDNAACCGVCLATPACTVSVLTNTSCHLKRFNMTVDNKTLRADPNSVVCVPLPKPGQGPAGASYPPLPKPTVRDNATFPAASRLDSGFPRLSMENPEKLGFPGIARDGFAAPNVDKMCLPKGRPFPLPTNDWWVPIIRPTPETTLNYIFPVPYIYDMFPAGFHLAYPFIITSPNSVRNIINRYWTVTAEGADEASSSYCVRHFDELTATVAWRATTNQSMMEMPIVRGSPYATVKYFQAQPKLSTAQKVRAFFVDGVRRNCSGDSFPGHKFTVWLLDSDEEWQFWVPPGTPVVCQVAVERGMPAVVVSVADPAFSGWVRLALSNNCTTGMVPPSPHCVQEGMANEDMEDYSQALDTGSNACPMKGKVGMRATGRQMEYILEWEVAHCWPPSFFQSSSLLLIALPHHIAKMQDGFTKIVPAGGHRNTRGYNTPVQTPHNRWVLEIKRTALGWVETPDARRLDFLRTYLVNNDSHFDLPPDVQRGYIDPYNAGKEMSRLARLVIIAQKLGEEEIAGKLNDKLVAYLSVWLDYKSANPLLYDKSWGGMVSCGCSYVWLEQEKKARCSNNAKYFECPVLRDMNADFGNGHYNDHHFHYGYFLYAAAIAAHVNPAWGKTYNEKMLLLLRDIANPNRDDPYFPQFRHFDWYLGHSWASGIVSSPNGKNQESTSEAVNAHFGIYLYGLATNHKPLSEMGEALLLMEAHSSKYYWYGAGGVFPDEYQHHMAGIVHDLLFEFQTYFGPQTYFVHGIHVLPLTGATQFLLSPDWVAKSIRTFDAACEADSFCLGSGFITFAHASRAFLDKDVAWDRLAALPDQGPFNVFDIGSGGGNGNSKTSTLFWCASLGNDAAPPMDAYFQDTPTAVARHRRRTAERWLAVLAVVALACAATWYTRQRQPEAFDRVGRELNHSFAQVNQSFVEPARLWGTMRYTEVRGYFQGYHTLD